MSDELREGLLDWIGKPMGSGGPALAPDPVNVPMIRHWVDALDDRNPVYLDEEVARQSRFGGIVAPPAMLQTWTMGRPKIEGIRERGGSSGDLGGENPITMLAAAGYTGTLATNSELEFVRYLRPGDDVEGTTALESISEKKKTGLGEGYFVTWVTTYATRGEGEGEGEVVGRQLFRILKFRPSVEGDDE
jgi:acyl dehydratase